MKRKLIANGLLIMVFALLCGCQSFTVEEAEIHDEIFSYELPFDRVFLRIIDVIDQTPEWTLDSTNQMDGLIMVRGTGYDAKQVIIVIKRVEKLHVTVEIGKRSQRVRGVGRLLKAIDTALINEL